MSEQNVAIVSRAHDALNSGDIEALVSVCAPSFRLDMSDRLLNPAVYEGYDGIRRFYDEVMEVWETFTWEPTELRSHGDLVVARVHSTGRGRGSGLELDRESAMLWRIRDGRALSLTFYREVSRALEAAGLRR